MILTETKLWLERYAAVCRLVKGERGTSLLGCLMGLR
jgi:hypothetical protein